MSSSHLLVEKMREKEFIFNDVIYLQHLDSTTDDEIDREDDEYQVKVGSHQSLDSEKSYSPVTTRNTILERLTYLTFNLTWMFILSVVHTILFVILTYQEVFLLGKFYVFCLVVKLICNKIFALDLISTFIHIMTKDVSKKIYIKRNRVIFAIDVISFVYTYILMHKTVHSISILRYIDIALTLFRLHRAIGYYFEVSKTAGFNSVLCLLQKYGLLFILCTHIFSLFWQTLNRYDTELQSQCWSDTIDEFIELQPPSAHQWYIICLYCILGSFASLGLGFEHKYNTKEAIVLVVVMIVGLSIMNGVLLGAFTSVQSDSYRRHAQFGDRFKLISTSLTHKKLTKKLKKKILQYYLSFWRQQGAIKRSRLFMSLPESLQQQVLLDKYFNALNQSHLFRNVHDAYKRGVASVMNTEIFAQGEVIFAQGKQNNKMFYIARGTVQILSGNDGESPILTLDMGSVLGEINLLYCSESPCQVIASSFCIVHFLDKRDLWRVNLNFRKLKQSKKLHRIMRGKIENAYDKEDLKGFAAMFQGSQNIYKTEKALKKIKHEIFVEKIKNDYSERSKQKKGRFYLSDNALSDIYIVSKQQTALKHTDEICLHTSWPWILQPESSFLTFWESIVSIVVIYVSFTYPYFICFKKNIPDLIDLSMTIADIVFIFDLILQLFTAVEDEHGIHTKLTTIFGLRFRSPSFLFDGIAIIPMGSICKFTSVTKDRKILNVTQLSRLLKLLKMFRFAKKLENSFRCNLGFIRGIKYVFLMIITPYFIGAFYYMIACFNPQCQDSWVSVISDADLSTGGKRSEYSFEISLYFAMMVLSQAGFARIYAYNYVEMGVMIIFFLVGIITFSYLVSDYSATLMLADRSFNIYIQTVTVIRTFMVTNRMPISLQNRTNEYLASQWRHKKGMLTLDLLYDAPAYLYEEQQAAKYSSAFAVIPLFQELEISITNELAAKCSTLLLPPNEIVVYAGEVSKEMFIIERGYCEVISAISGKIENNLAPGEHFYALEMLLEQPGIFNIRTLTHVRLIKISLKSIMTVLNAYPEVKSDIVSLVLETKQSLSVQRMFMRSRTIAYQELIEEESQSWFVFPRRKLDPRNIDYLRVFENMGICKISKVFLLRRTILPYGKFICIWEVFRACSALLSGMLYPALIIYQTVMPTMSYVRLHVCYYNVKGILVTHPKCTALYYLSHSFFFDIISYLPADALLGLVYSKSSSGGTKYLTYQAYIRYLKLIQLYRVPDAFALFKKDLFKPPGVILNTLLYILLSVVVFNALATILILISYDIKDKSKIVANPNTWLSMNDSDFSFDLNNPIHIYVTAYYFMASTALSINFGDLIAVDQKEMYLLIFIIIIGYIIFTYIFVIISSSKATINVNLTLYQQHMKHLISYMKKENIPKILQKRAIDHFEYIWKRTHGMKASNILKQCHPALREDCVLSLYENTLAEVSIFEDVSKSFYRLLGTNLEEAYFLRDSTIIGLNDIIHTVYIIHKGEVSVIGPDGSLFAVLTKGCVFGSLDDVSYSRSMVKVVASKPVDLLYISSATFYKLINSYQVVRTRLRKYILLENMCYITKKIDGNSLDTEYSEEKIESQHNKKEKCLDRVADFLYSKHFEVIMMVVSYISCVIVCLHAAFQRQLIWVIIVTYICDVLHVVKFIACFYTPYIGSMGEMVTERKHIKRRKMCSGKVSLPVGIRFLYHSPEVPTVGRSAVFILKSYLKGMYCNETKEKSSSGLCKTVIFAVMTSFIFEFTANVIRNKNLSRLLRLPKFYMNLFAILPFEVFCPLAVSSRRMFLLSLLRLTKLTRWINITAFFNVTYDYLNVNIFIVRFASVAIYFTLLLHLGACVLYMTACWGGYCQSTNWIKYSDDVEKCDNHYLCSIFYVSSVITFSGYGAIIPRSITDLVTVTLVMIFGKFFIATFVGDMSAIVYSLSSTLVNYDHSMKKLKEFLKIGYISPPLRNQILMYAYQLWNLNKGVQLPHLLLEAPSFLIEQLKKEAYGKHLEESYLFNTCHKDFIRLLTAKLKILTFFAGDVICQMGDINNTMFFIHKGVINVFAVTVHEEEQVDQLKEKDCFGIIQGLFPYTPHTHTYIATNVTVVVTLNLSDWLILLKFYPAARFDIYRKVQKI